MNVAEIKEQIEALTSMIPAEDESKFDIFYGVFEDKLGFHIVAEDYPNYFISFLGHTFVEAELDIEENWSD